MEEEESVFCDFVNRLRNMETAIYLGDNLMDKLDWESKNRTTMKQRNQVVNLMKKQIKEARSLSKIFNEELSEFLSKNLDKVNKLKPTKRKASTKEKASKKRQLTEILIEEIDNPITVFEEPQEPIPEPQETAPEVPQNTPEEHPPSPVHESPPSPHPESPPAKWEP